MKHAILGAGGVGGIIGTALASTGEEVIVVVRPQSLPGYPATLTLERPGGAIEAPARAVAALTEPVDVLWVGTKAYSLQRALGEILAQPGCVVPLLNGVDHIELLRARFGRDGVVPGSIRVEAERVAPGRFIQRSPFLRLALAAAGEPLLGEVAKRLETIGATVQFVANERTLLWTKLCLLGPMALVSSASGLDKGGIAADRAWRSRLSSAVDEACAVAEASGAEIDKPALWFFWESIPPAMRTSMQKDLAAGKPIELDALAGPVLRGGKRYGIDVSATAALEAAISRGVPRADGN
jgi:2-dehydropantoate 2-reductase